MPENEFEKQIQDRLDSLNLEPSAAVWQQVEFRIRKDKRRRWFIWIPLVAAGIGAGTWLLTGAEKSGLAKPNLQQEAVPQTNAANKNSQPLHKQANTQPSENPSSDVADNNVVNDDLQKKDLVVNTNKAKNQKSNSKTKHIAAATTSKASSDGSNPLSIEDSDVISESSTETVNAKVAPAPGEKAAGIDSSNLLKKNAEAAITRTEKTKAAAAPKKKAGRVWSFGLQAAVGVSAQSERIFGTTQHTANDLTTGSLGNPAAIPTNYDKAPLKSAMAFSFGAYAERRLSKVLSFEIGLMYSQYGTKIEAGKSAGNTAFITLSNSRYTSVQNYYQALGGNSFASSYTSESSLSFHNRYHYLEMPLKLNIRLNPSGKTTFRWELGFSPAYMIASNALQYDDQQNVYYHDNTGFNRFQVGFNSALAVRLFGKSKHPIWIGPEYRSFLTNLTNLKNTNGNHLYYGGLKASFKLR